jgi:hypothetical protein
LATAWEEDGKVYLFNNFANQPLNYYNSVQVQGTSGSALGFSDLTV